MSSLVLSVYLKIHFPGSYDKDLKHDLKYQWESSCQQHGRGIILTNKFNPNSLGPLKLFLILQVKNNVQILTFKLI